jgi:hypothetical protein
VKGEGSAGEREGRGGLPQKGGKRGRRRESIRSPAASLKPELDLRAGQEQILRPEPGNWEGGRRPKAAVLLSGRGPVRPAGLQPAGF